MSNLKVLIICVINLLLVANINVMAQNGRFDQTIKISPPSPDAVSLGKYGESPVSLYSGQANTVIPVYKLTTGDIDLDINLSYMGGGIKVEEISSLVGLGWTLNAGGVITRSIKGVADDASNGYFAPYLDENIRPTNSNYTLSDYSKWRLASGFADGESDVYYFNFGNNSGSFYFDSNKQIHLNNFQSIKIIPYISSQIDSFKVITNKGVEYLFNQKEYQSSSTRCEVPGQVPPSAWPSSSTYASSWYLSQIKSPTGVKISFEYDASTYSVGYEILGNERKYNPVTPLTNGQAVSFIKQGSKCKNFLLLTNYKRLSKITFDNGFIEFQKGHERTDVPGLPQLGSIIIHNATSLLKHYDFNYHYFSNRLMLETINEVSAITGQTWMFYYDETGNLPDRESFAQDHWGYYNGHSENNTLIPAFTLGGKYISGANRNVDTAYNHFGILKKIIYPTGGSTSFEYETNIAHNINDYPIYNQKNKFIQRSTDPTKVTVPNWNSSVPIPIDTLSFTINTVSNYTQGIYVNGVWADLGMKIPYRYFNSQPSSIANVGAQYELWDNTTNTKLASNVDFGNPLYSQAYASGDTAFTYKLPNKVFLNKAHNFSLIQYVKPNVYNRFNAFPYYFSVSYQQDTTLNSNDVFVGGLRLKKIRDVDNITGKSVSRSYIYQDSSKSTGYVLDYPRYFYNYTDNFTISQFNDCNKTTYSSLVNNSYKVALSNSYYPLSTTKGVYLGYSQVTELLSDSLKTVSNFTSPADFNSGDFYEFNGTYLPIPTSDFTINANTGIQYRSYDWKRGLIKNKVDYRLKAGTYYKLKEENHFYTINANSLRPHYNETYNFTGTIVSNDWYGYLGNSPSVCLQGLYSTYSFYPPPVNINFYRNTSGYMQEDSTIIKTYNSTDTSKFIIAKTQFVYDTLNLEPAKITIDKSDGNQKISYFKYAPDYDLSSVSSGSAMGIRNMIQKNVITEPIEKYSVTQKGALSTIISGELTTYKASICRKDTVYILDNPGSISNFQPSQILNGAINKNINYKPRYTFTDYDTRGNLLSGKQIAGPPITYLWGYQDNLPVAEIKNADYNSVSTALSNAGINISDLSSQPIVSSMDLRNIRNAITAALPQTQVTTYTYDPLVGVTSMTDPKGMVTTYEYDSLQRLINIRDNHGDIIKHLDYHYQGY